MRISFSLFRREIAAVHIDPEEVIVLDHLGAEVDLAEPAPLGFHVDRNPSLEDEDED